MNEPRIVKDASCADDYDPDSMPAEAALRRILAGIEAVEGFEKLAIRSALNRVLAGDVHSRIDVPQHTNSAMDGYALRAGDLPKGGMAELAVIGTSWAGRPYLQPVHPGECVRIMTGAVMPQGTDTVVMQEHAERDGERIRIDDSHRTGQNVRAAGEDVAAGQVVLGAGHRLTPADLGMLAALGTGEVTVRRQLRVAFFSTGDELRSIGEPLDAGAIYDSNRYTLYGMLARLGAAVIDMGVVRDTREATRTAFLDAASCADAVITSGGVSVGEADFVKETLDAVGRVNFWKVAMKPGRPLAFGTVGDAKFFGLPGNPVSVMVTFYQFVQPALRKMMGERVTEPLRMSVRCVSRLRKRPGRTEFQRGVLERDEHDGLVVRKTGEQGSGILRSMSEANCFIVLPLDSGPVEPGTMVEVQPFFGLV